jgi:FixJ family two-component response regulator
VDETAHTICVIDDDASVRKAMRRLLCAEGFNVEIFESAEDFLQAERAAEPACLLLDVRMPGKNGLELQAVLAAQGRRVPIIFLTGHEDDAVRRRALQAGAAGFFTKPFDRQLLLDALAHALSGNL